MKTVLLDKFTPQALACIEAAKKHAEKRGRPITGAEDLLFGLLYDAPQQPESKVVFVMKEAFGVTRIDVFNAIKALPSGPSVLHRPGREFTEGAKRALTIANEREASGTVVRFDLMVGLARSGDVVLNRVLRTLDVDPLKLAHVMSHSLAWVGTSVKR